MGSRDYYGTPLSEEGPVDVGGIGCPHASIDQLRRYAALLEGQRVLPRRLLEEGFRFSYPRLSAALDALASALR